MTDLKRRLTDRDARIGVIGLGYVGLPIAIEFTSVGFDVAGFDIDSTRVARLRNADSYVDDVSDTELKKAIESRFIPGNTPETVSDCDAYVIAVPTGINDGEPQIGSIESATETIADQMGERETLVVVTSTVYPGATNDVVSARLTAERPTEMTRIAMVPERLNPGSEYNVHEIPLVVGADDNSSRKAAQTLFETIVESTVPVSCTETAELVKVLENTYRMVNIALVNQLVDLTEQLNVDVWEAINAASTKPFGFQAFYPGPGVGGHCIPVDPQFLTWRARDIGTKLPLIEQSHEVNERMPKRVVDEVLMSLRARGVDPESATIVALGASYKPNVADMRNSPALTIATELEKISDLILVDPHIDQSEVTLPLCSQLEEVDVEQMDAAVLLVDHDAFDLTYLGTTAEFVYDTRDAMPEGVAATVVTLGVRERKNNRT